jgi:hypothetical protein
MVADVAAIEAGVELDRLVCAAIGHELVFFDAETRAQRQFRPSWDWSDAMFAAEKFGLFDVHGAGLQQAREWNVMERVGGREFNEDIASAPTGPLAISRAIIALRASK